MERTTITMDEYGRVAVPSDTANIWMSEMDLVELFDTIAPTLRAAIRAVYKSGALKPCEVERRIKLPNGLTYTAYQYGGNDRYQTRRSVGRYYTFTKELLEKL